MSLSGFLISYNIDFVVHCFEMGCMYLGFDSVI